MKKEKFVTIIVVFALVLSNCLFMAACTEDKVDLKNVKVEFVALVPSDTPFDSVVTMGGSMNNWDPTDEDWIATFKEEGTFVLTKTFDLTSPVELEYKWSVQSEGQSAWYSSEINLDGKPIENRKITLSNDKKRIVDNVARFSNIGNAGTTIVGRLTKVTIDMPQMGLNSKRTLRIWTPSNYNKVDTAKKYSVLYMHDGQNLFDRFTSFAGEWKVDESINSMIAAGTIGDCIVVGIDNSNNRMQEYTPDWGTEGALGDKYAAFVADTVKPYIDANYNTKTAREFTCIAGSSMGGLISFYIALEYPNIFGMAGVFSPSFQVPEEEFRQSYLATRDFTANVPRMYIDAGGMGGESQLTPYVAKVANELAALNYPTKKIYTKVNLSHLHNEEAWSQRFPSAYKWLSGLDDGNFSK